MVLGGSFKIVSYPNDMINSRADADAPQQQDKLGLWTTTSLVVGNMIGAGVFLMPAALAAYGSISLLGWVFSSMGAFLLAKVFSNLSKLLPTADGGPYA